ncbi:hypothetical protein ACFIQG_20195 [Comamonas odontotermitis]|uniref:hypothetical protein n=1 Tax=Comamonas odontotermitis TaxID=379895 RepID=UPI00366B48A8
MAQLKTLKEIGLMAVELHVCTKNRKAASDSLKDAYRRWAHNTGTFHHFDRDSDEWNRMMIATDPEYQLEQAAKRKERNAMNRLHRAISKGVQL